MTSADALAEHLRDVLSDSDALKWGMTPQLAYGRHRGPARLRSRQAAVAVCLAPIGRPSIDVAVQTDLGLSWQVILTRRPAFLQHHGGQVCFPGGKMEAGETPEQAAVREFEEELGLAPNVRHRCGRLPKQYVYASDNEVTPVVMILGELPEEWSPDPGEVDEVIALPIEYLIPNSNIELTRQLRTIQDRSGTSRQSQIARLDFTFDAPAYKCAGHQIWGATAVVLDQLAQCLRKDRCGSAGKRATTGNQLSAANKSGS